MFFVLFQHFCWFEVFQHKEYSKNRNEATVRFFVNCKINLIRLLAILYTNTWKFDEDETQCWVSVQKGKTYFMSWDSITLYCYF